MSAQWRPVLAGELRPALAGELGPGALPPPARELVEQRARALGIQEVRWPEPFPFDSAFAMRVATYAQQIGRTVPFAQAAFRQAYAGGRSLGEPDNVLIAAAACEMHPAAVLRAGDMRSVAAALARTTAQAAMEGVRELPAIVLPEGWGRVGEADGALRRTPSQSVLQRATKTASRARIHQGPEALAEAVAELAAAAAAAAAAAL